MDVRSLILGELEKAKVQIQNNLANEGINASGRTSKSLHIVDSANSLSLVIGGTGTRTAPLETLEIGSRPGKRGNWFKSVIYYWTIEKGMSFTSDSHRWAVSTIIADNIIAGGTKRHKTHVDVYSTVVESTKASIRKNFYLAVNAEIKSAINNFK